MKTSLWQQSMKMPRFLVYLSAGIVSGMAFDPGPILSGTLLAKTQRVARTEWHSRLLQVVLVVAGQFFANWLWSDAGNAASLTVYFSCCYGIATLTPHKE